MCIEPIGEQRADFRAGIIASTFANLQLKATADPYSIQDFMPFLDKAEPEAQKPDGDGTEALRTFLESKVRGS